MAGNVPDWLRTNHKKTSNSKVQTGVRSRPIFHGEHVDNPLLEEHEHTSAAFYSNGGKVRLADGGDPTEAQLKQMGMEASDRERAAGGRPGFMEGIRNTIQRFQEGNIDAPGSLAYERYGAGRGRQEYENQKAFAEGSKMQGDGMRNASMVMGGKSAVDTGKAEVNATKDISPTPSAEYKDTESMKSDAVRGQVSSLPTPSETMRPMGDVVEAKPSRRVSPRPSAAPSVSTTRSVSPSVPADSGSRTVVIPNNPRPPVDNESRPSKPAAKGEDNSSRQAKAGAKGGNNTERQSKPYPADQAVQNLGKTFKSADEAYRADPKNAAKKAERDRAYKAYEKAARTLR